MKRYNLLFILLIIISCINAENKKDVNPKSTTHQKIEKYLKSHVSNGKFNGNILICKGDSVFYSNSFGMANREHSIKNSDSTKFLIGSVTKPFTAMGILILEHQGKLKLTDKLSKYYPDFIGSNEITLKQLLTHTSGLSDYRSLIDWKEDSKSDATTPELIINKMSEIPLLFNPGENFKYSNVGYILLGLIIEKVSGQNFESFVNKEILTPLQLTNTGIIDNNDIILNLANGYKSNPRNTIKAEYINYLQPFSSGNMYSTSSDLLKFTRAVMNNQLLPKEKTKEIFESGKYYGYGWGIRDFSGIKAYGHYGGMNGFVSSITYIPTEDWFICLLTNDDNTPKVRITQDIVSILHLKKVPFPKNTSLIPISNSIKTQIIGDYLVKPGVTLKVFEENNQLFMQENGQIKHQLFPYSNYKYSFELLEFNVFFGNLTNNKTKTLNFVSSDTLLEAIRIKE